MSTASVLGLERSRRPASGHACAGPRHPRLAHLTYLGIRTTIPDRSLGHSCGFATRFNDGNAGAGPVGGRLCHLLAAPTNRHIRHHAAGEHHCPTRQVEGFDAVEASPRTLPVVDYGASSICSARHYVPDTDTLSEIARDGKPCAGIHQRVSDTQEIQQGGHE